MHIQIKLNPKVFAMFIAPSFLFLGNDLLHLFSQQVFIKDLLVLGTRGLAVHETKELSTLID